MIRLILASASERRKMILNQIGLEFDIVPAQGEEHSISTIPSEMVQELAAAKAKEVAERLIREGRTEGLVIGADTLVFLNQKPLGKPRDEEDAYRMIASLAGRDHSVLTGVAFSLIRQGKIAERHCFYEETRVWFYEMTEKEIRAYIQTKDPMDKAGAYGIQGPFAAYVRKLEGDYQNVVGLPADRVYQELKGYLW